MLDNRTKYRVVLCHCERYFFASATWRYQEHNLGGTGQAFSNVVKRMLEAAGRGMWKADSATIDKLKGLYSNLEDELEGVK